MTFVIDHKSMHDFAAAPPKPSTEFDLCRGGRVFFVGGTLPVHATLETMFESYCAEATDLFVLTFGDEESIGHGLDMAKQIKKNFSIRLMVRLNHAIPEWLFPQIYASGADLVDIVDDPPADPKGDSALDEGQKARYLAAQQAFPPWSAASTLAIDGRLGPSQIRTIDELLRIGIIPLPRLAWNGVDGSEAGICDVLHHLAGSWHTHGVPIKPFQALIGLSSPLVPAGKRGALRSIIDRFHDRRKVAAADLLRHLRVSVPTDSLDSAAL